MCPADVDFLSLFDKVMLADLVYVIPCAACQGFASELSSRKSVMCQALERVAKDPRGE